MAEADNPRAVKGDNSDKVEQVAVAQLKSIVERIERLDEEKKSITDDIKDVYGEAKAVGYDTRALRRIIALRKKDANEREEFLSILELYANSLGMTGVFA